MKAAFLGMVAALLFFPLTLAANDSAASKAVGGIVLTREPRISMESERLTISLSKITVEYEFLNESDKDITTEVVFPIPPYSIDEYESAAGMRMFDDFKVWVDGRPVKSEIDAKAIVNGEDKTADVRRLGLDVATIGHFGYSNKDGGDVSSDFVRMSAENKAQARRAGILGKEYNYQLPSWTVRKTYHWRQTFPAHQVLRVRHEYTPAFGFEPMDLQALDEASRAKYLARDKPPGLDKVAQGDVDRIKNSCVDSSLQKAIFARGSASLKADPRGGAGYLETSWVDYILTTANSWKTPIKKFELIVELGPKQDMGLVNWDYASFCWYSPVTRLDAHQYEVSATDFIPKSELKVLFLTMPAAEAGGKGLGTGSGSRRSRWIWVGMVAGILVLVGIWWVQGRRPHSSR